MANLICTFYIACYNRCELIDIISQGMTDVKKGYFASCFILSFFKY